VRSIFSLSAPCCHSRQSKRCVSGSEHSARRVGGEAGDFDWESEATPPLLQFHCALQYGLAVDSHHSPSIRFCVQGRFAANQIHPHGEQCP